MIRAPSGQNFRSPGKHSPGYSGSHAFTLIELIISIVIISIALAGTLNVLNLTSKFGADPMVNRQAVSIAQAYLNEILTQAFPTGFPCAAPGGSRATYSNICDYQGLVNVGPQDQYGNPIAGLGSYTVSVNIDGTTAALGTLTPGTQVVRIDVTVTRNSMATLIMSAYKSNH